MTEKIDAPDRIEGGNFDGAVLLGTEDGEAVYWNIASDELVKQTDRGESAHQPEDGDIPRYLAESKRDGFKWEFTPLGRFLHAAGPREVSATGKTVRVLGQKEAETFAVREKLEIGREKASRLLDRSKSTLDGQLATARVKLEIASDLDATCETDNDASYAG